jgi:hypothetical protein
VIARDRVIGKPTTEKTIAKIAGIAKESKLEKRNLEPQRTRRNTEEIAVIAGNRKNG